MPGSGRSSSSFGRGATSSNAGSAGPRSRVGAMPRSGAGAAAPGTHPLDPGEGGGGGDWRFLLLEDWARDPGQGLRSRAARERISLARSLSAKRLAPLAAEPGRDFSVWTFPRANHALVETKTGLTSEMLRSDRYARGMFPRVGAWLEAHGLS